MNARTIFEAPEGTPFSSSVTTPFWTSYVPTAGRYFSEVAAPVQTGAVAKDSDGYFAQFNPTF